MPEMLDYFAAKAALEWQFELGVDEAICELPQNRYAEDAKKPAFKMGKASNIAPMASVPNIFPAKEAAPDVARLLAAKCAELDELRNAMAVFELCMLKKGAKNMVFAQGSPKSDIMVVGDVPDRQEDQLGIPFQGEKGTLLDNMFAAIERTRSGEDANTGLYVTNVIPWRTPQDREPTADEIEMLKPFLQRHVELAEPKVLVLMGNTACQAGLGKAGVTRLRGAWVEAFGVPTLPMFHPSALLRDPLKKRDTWADLLAIKTRLVD